MNFKALDARWRSLTLKRQLLYAGIGILIYSLLTGIAGALGSSKASCQSARETLSQQRKSEAQAISNRRDDSRILWEIQNTSKAENEVDRACAAR